MPADHAPATEFDSRVPRATRNPPDARDRGGPQQPLLTARDLRKHFPVKGAKGKKVQAVDGVSFVLRKVQVFALEVVATYSVLCFPSSVLRAKPSPGFPVVLSANSQGPPETAFSLRQPKDR